MTADLLALAAARAPEAPAVAGPDAAWTYRELDQRATDLAQRLVGLGVGRGGIVGLALPGSAMAVALVHAVARAGGVLVPLDPRMPAPEVAARCQLTGVRVLLAEQAPPGLDRGVQVRGVLQLLRTKPGRVPLFVRLAEEVQALVFTSGTSGRPRAAMVTHGNQQASAAASARNLGTGPGDRWLPCVPLHHIGGLAAVFRAAHDAAALQVLPRFDAGAVNDAVDRDGVTVLSVVPVMLQRLLDDRAGRPFPRTLRAVLLGGDAAPRALLERCRAEGVPVLPTYGCTECCSQVACAAPGDAALPPGASGKPLPGVKVFIEDEAGRSLPPGQEGEIVVRGAIVARGYYDEPQGTAQAFRGDGFHTGDLGVLDRDGYLSVTGRRSERIVTGGEKVDPRQVEDVLRQHPAVRDACVVGLPDPAWGQVVAAAVVAGPAIAPEALAAHCRAALPGYAVPRRWAFVEGLPVTASGKLLRSKVRETFPHQSSGGPPGP